MTKKDILLITSSIVLFLGLVAVILVGRNIYSSKMKNITEQALASTAQQQTVTEEPTKEEETKTEETTQKTEVVQQPVQTVVKPFEKLKAKSAVSVLVIGDGIASSEGVGDGDKWYNLFTAAVEKEYTVKPSVKVMASAGAGVAKTLQEYEKNEAANKYDFVIVCVGEYDINKATLADFQANYDNLLKKIKSGNDNCEIITMIESSIRINTTYPNAISTVSSQNGASLLDLRAEFKASGTAFEKLTAASGVLPNKEGYKIYSNALLNLFKGKTK